jgi:hypothetical protein
MSDKLAKLELRACDQDSGLPVGLSAVVDSMTPGFLYLAMEDGERSVCVRVSSGFARELATFIQQQCADNG